MGAIRVLTETELRRAVGLGISELDLIEAVYPLITNGSASMAPIMRIDVPEHNGEIDIKSAYLPGYSGIAVKVSAGFFDNPAKGLPSLGGLMMVFDSETGVPRSALFDNGYLTDLRTALAGAVAAKHLATEEASTAPGLHISAVGSDAEGKQVISARAIKAADGFYCDSIGQSARLGELRAAVAEGFDPTGVVELGSVISGEDPGRTSAEQVTICDLTGTGAQGTAIASLAVERSRHLGAGITIET